MIFDKLTSQMLGQSMKSTNGPHHERNICAFLRNVSFDPWKDICFIFEIEEVSVVVAAFRLVNGL